MDTEDDIRSALAQATGGPPMRLQADDVIARGGRIRRLRKRWAVAGSSVATAVVLAVAGFTAGHHGTEPTPVEPAGPELSTVATTTPPPSAEPSPTSATARPGTGDTPATSRGVPVPTSRKPGRTTAPTQSQKAPSATHIPTEPPAATATTR